jgi:hypothetical protein
VSKTNPLLWLAAGAGAVWAVSHWRTGAQRDASFGDEHDEDEVEVVRDDSKGLTRKFDAAFEKHGRGLPVPYLRALAARESGMREKDPKGLINVVRVVREDFNERHGTAHRPQDLQDPIVSITIAADTLRRIIDSYARNHPAVPNLREDWANRHFVELLTFGWNAGYSEKAGVGHVVDYLERQGQTEITLAMVAKNAQAAGASHWLWAHPKKVSWTRSVGDLYFAERARDAAKPAVATAPAAPVGPVTHPSQVGG